VVGAIYNERVGQFEPVFGTHNSTRLPDFLQLDARVDRNFLLSDVSRLTVYLEVLNATNQSNGEEYFYNADYSQRRTITGIPIVGVLGIRVEI
jgi:hypothetical protein